MIKKLRNHIMFSNLLFTGLVLLGAFAAIFFSTYLTAKEDIQAKLLALPAMMRQGNVSLIPAPGSVLVTFHGVGK